MSGIYAFFFVLVLLFGLLFFYPISANILSVLDYNARQTEGMSAEGEGILNQTATMYKYLPIVLVLGFFIYAFYLLSNREPVEYGYAE